MLLNFYNNCNNILPVYLQPNERKPKNTNAQWIRIILLLGWEFLMDGSFFRWKSMTIEQFTDP